MPLFKESIIIMNELGSKTEWQTLFNHLAFFIPCAVGKLAKVSQFCSLSINLKSL